MTLTEHMVVLGDHVGISALQTSTVYEEQATEPYDLHLKSDRSEDLMIPESVRIPTVMNSPQRSRC